MSASNFAHKSGAAAAFAEHADPAEAYRFDLRDPERLINALAEFRIAALADIDKFHIHRHARAAVLLLKTELIDEDNLDIAADGIEFLHALVIRRFASGQIGQAFAVHYRPMIMLLHFANVIAAPRRDFG